MYSPMDLISDPFHPELAFRSRNLLNPTKGPIFCVNNLLYVEISYKSMQPQLIGDKRDSCFHSTAKYA